MESTTPFIDQMYQLLEFIINASHFSFVVIIVCVLLFYYLKNRTLRILLGMMIIGSMVFVYARYIETYWLKITNVTLERGWDTRIVLIADQHLGVYKDGDYMKKVVERINTIPDVDFVFIAGDFTYWPLDLESEHQSLGDLTVPVYAVLGNHDVSQSGWISFERELQELLPKYNVTLMKNDIITTESGVTIYGLGSHVGHVDDVSLLSGADQTEQNVLILTHNPDTTLKQYPHVDLSNTVTMTGHTHCGQVRIPWLYKYAIPTVGDFPNRGPYDLGTKGTLLITCGLGETGLPLRLFNRPEIMVVDL